MAYFRYIVVCAIGGMFVIGCFQANNSRAGFIILGITAVLLLAVRESQRRAAALPKPTAEQQAKRVAAVGIFAFIIELLRVGW